ncbi:MAG: hypothetical protein K2F59_02490 [Eubacteriales bacterium]|nr:hypothetical protein [Eubacteriales bacterium]
MCFAIGQAKVYVGGTYEPLDVAPYIQTKTNSTMIPLKYVATVLNIPENNVVFNAKNKTVTITKGNDVLEFFVNSNSYKKNGVTFNGNGIVEIKGGRTFVPLRSLANAFDLYVEWDGYLKEAIVVANIDTTNQNITDSDKDINYSSTINNTTNNINKPSYLSAILSKNRTPEEEKCVTRDYIPTEQETRIIEEEVVRIVNEERIKNGLQPLQISEDLMKTAREKSEDMATRNYVSHTDPDGYNMATDLKVAENITGGNYTPAGAVDDWLNSKGHRDNILNPNYKYIGVGYAKNSNSEYTNYWTQQFSR